MDPWTALSAASCILQVVDFGTKLLAETVKVYKSGAGRSTEHMLLSDIATDLSELTTNVQTTVAMLPQEVQSPADANFLRLCAQGQDLSNELQESLDKLQRKGVTRLDLTKSSLRAALRTIWPDEKIKQLTTQLGQIREHMVLAAVVFLWEQERLGSAKKEQFFQEHARLSEAVNRIEENTNSWGNALLALTSNGVLEARDNRAAWITTVWNSDWQPPEYEVSSAAGQYQNEKIEELLDKTIMDSLKFSAMDDRESTISETYAQTYQWIFRSEDQTNSEISGFSNFSSWLKSTSNEIYWITGKPGAGKSTLIKYICSNPLTAETLQTWSKPLPLAVASFYFWNAGTPMQKSHDGLLRTILFQYFIQIPGIIRRACPKRWALAKLFGQTASLPSWTWKELEETMTLVVNEHGKTASLALFIDGLDEFQGNHSQLVDLIKRLVSKSNIKLCVSSRPWNIFDDSFKRSPSLRLEMLSKGDIELVAQGELAASPGYQELKEAFPEEAQQLEDHLVSKAQGVFLWVTLVLRSLLEGLTEGDKIKDLKQRLDDLPEDLEQLFQKILDSVDSKYSSDASHFIQLLEASTGDLTLLRLWAADEYDDLTTNLFSIQSAALKGIQQTMKRRLNSRTRGLIEASDEQRVTYIHRTVRDWILSPDVWSYVLSLQKARFDPNLELCRAAMLEYSYDPASEFESAWLKLSPALTYASRVRANAVTTDRLRQVLDKLDQKIVMEWKTHSNEQHKFFCTMTGAFDRNSELRKAIFSLPTHDSFLALAATLGLNCYVTSKISKEPNLYSQSHLKHLLVCAVLGYQLVRYYGTVGTVSQRIDLNNEVLAPAKRLEMVNFLLGRMDKIYIYQAATLLGPTVDLWTKICPPPNAEWENYWRSVRKSMYDLSRIKGGGANPFTKLFSLRRGSKHSQ